MFLKPSPNLSTMYVDCPHTCHTGLAFGWGERGSCPRRRLQGGAEKEVTTQPHVNTLHCSMAPEISVQLKVCMARRSHFSFASIALLTHHGPDMWQIFIYRWGGRHQLFDLPRLSHGQRPALISHTMFCVHTYLACSIEPCSGMKL
jgi:hypothetical protein